MAAISTIDPSREDHADPSFATTLAHGLDVLAAFRNHGGSLSNAELALHTGLSRPTVSRLTYTLAQLGYLKRDAKGRFELGLGILLSCRLPMARSARSGGHRRDHTDVPPPLVSL